MFAIVLLIYMGLYLLNPQRTEVALKNCAGILGQMALPIGLVFIFMALLNITLSPGRIVKFLGREAGIRGLSLSTAAGILSVGPIYAWYPLLKNLRERGASNAVLATFLCNRSVKPFLIPVMISFFGWRYVVILTFFSILGSVVVGIGVGALTDKGKGDAKGGERKE